MKGKHVRRERWLGDLVELAQSIDRDLVARGVHIVNPNLFLRPKVLSGFPGELRPLVLARVAVGVELCRMVFQSEQLGARDIEVRS